MMKPTHLILLRKGSMIRDALEVSLTEQQAAQVYLAKDYPYGGERIKKIDCNRDYVLMRGSKLAITMKNHESRYGYTEAVALKVGKSLAQKLENSKNNRIAYIKTKHDIFSYGNHVTRQAMYSAITYSFCTQYNKQNADTYEMYFVPQIALFKITGGYAIVRGDGHKLQSHIKLSRAYELAHSVLLTIFKQVDRITKAGNLDFKGEKNDM